MTEAELMHEAAFMRSDDPAFLMDPEHGRTPPHARRLLTVDAADTQPYAARSQCPELEKGADVDQPGLSTPGFGLDPLLEEAADPVLVLDPLEDRFVAANPAGCALLGFTPEVLYATPVSQVHPCELPRLGELVSEVLAVGHCSAIMLTCRTSAGDYLPAEMSLSTFEKEGRTYVLALVRDRSEHRQSG